MYGVGFPEDVFPAVKVFEEDIRENCGLTLQRTKSKVFSSTGVMPEGCLPGFQPAGDMIDGQFQPGFMVVGAPMGSDVWVKQKMKDKVRELKEDSKQMQEVLGHFVKWVPKDV